MHALRRARACLWHGCIRGASHQRSHHRLLWYAALLAGLTLCGHGLTLDCTCRRVYVQFYRRVYNAQLADGRDVVVKVLPRHQAQHEAGILHYLAPHPKTRAIDLLCELPLRCGSVALVMPLVPHRLFEKATPEMVLQQWLQLCEVSGWLHLEPVPNTTHADTCLRDIIAVIRLCMRGTSKASLTWISRNPTLALTFMVALCCSTRGNLNA